MEKAYKFRIYPNAEQKSLMQRTFGCCRFVYNHYLSMRVEAYRTIGKSINRYEQDRDMTVLKKELEWLKKVDATALQSALGDLDAAYKNFFRRTKNGEKPGFPRFKSKKNNRKSYKSKNTNGGTTIFLIDNHIRLPKLGLWGFLTGIALCQYFDGGRDIVCHIMKIIF